MGLDPLEHRNTVDPLAEPNMEIVNNSVNESYPSSPRHSGSRENSADRPRGWSPDSSGSFEFTNKGGDSDRDSSQGADSSQGQSNPGSKNYKEYVGRQLTSELLFSASIGNLKRIKRCLEKAGKSITSEPYQDYDLRAPLHIACADGSFAIVDYLVKNGVAINAVDRWGATPLECAVFGNHGEIVKYIEQNGGKIKDRLTGTLVKLSDSHLSSVAAPQLANSSNIFLPQDAMAWEIPEEEIVDKENIGSGAFGIVMKCKWRGTPVAIKQIHKHMAEDEIARVEFALELKVMRQLHHPNIVQFLGVMISSETSQVSIVSEFMQGGSLDHLFRSGKLISLCEAANMALDCARGMAYLHGRVPLPVIHRDLKPGNLMLTNRTFENRRFRFVENFIRAKQDSKLDGFSRTVRFDRRNGQLSIHGAGGFPTRILRHRRGCLRRLHDFLPTLLRSTTVLERQSHPRGARVATQDTRPPLHNGLMPKEFMTLVRNMWNPIDKKRPRFSTPSLYLDPIVEKLREEADNKKNNAGCGCVIS